MEYSNINNITIGFILKYTGKHTEEPLLGYMMMIAASILTLTQKENFDKYFFLIGNIILIGGSSFGLSKGYFLDLVIKKVETIEGETGYISGIIIWRKGYGSIINVIRSDGKKVELYYYDAVKKHCLKNKKRVGECKIIYHYLKFSKVIVDVEYIPINQKNNSANKLKKIKSKNTGTD